MKPSKELIMKAKVIASIAVLMLAKSALAGGSSAGNGGNTIVCMDGNGQIKSVELLDFYEARVKRNVSPDLGDATLTVDEKVEIAFKRIEKVSDYEAINLRYEYEQHFKKDSVFLPGIRLVTVDDSDHLFVPAGCQQEQTAVQKTPEFPGDKLYNIDQDLWNHMDANNRAGLILHEIFYRQAILHGHPDDSVPVRFLVSSIASAASIGMKDLVEVFRALKFGGIVLRGYGFKIGAKQPMISEDGTLMGGDLMGAADLKVQGQNLFVTGIDFGYDGAIAGFKLMSPSYLEMNGQNYWFAADKYIAVNSAGDINWGAIMPQNTEFKKDGQYDLHLAESTTDLVLLGFEDGKLLQCDHCVGQVTISGQVLDVDSYRSYGTDGLLVHLSHPSLFKYLGRDLKLQSVFGVVNGGNLSTATLAVPTHLPVAGKEVLFGEGPVSFALNVLNCGVLGEDTVLTTADGKQVPYMKGMLISFDTQGHVNRVGLPPVSPSPPAPAER